MGQLSSKLRNVAGGGLVFWCAGCDEAHVVWVGKGPGPRWTWNGDVDRPVLGPSVLVTYEHWVPPASAENPRPGPQTRVKDVCHSFVGCNGAKPGEIVYLSDCTHALAGKVIPLPDMPTYRSHDEEPAS